MKTPRRLVGLGWALLWMLLAVMVATTNAVTGKPSFTPAKEHPRVNIGHLAPIGGETLAKQIKQSQILEAEIKKQAQRFESEQKEFGQTNMEKLGYTPSATNAHTIGNHTVTHTTKHHASTNSHYEVTTNNEDSDNWFESPKAVLIIIVGKL